MPFSQMDRSSLWWSYQPSKWHSISRLRWWRKFILLFLSSFSFVLPTGAFLKTRKISGKNETQYALVKN